MTDMRVKYCQVAQSNCHLKCNTQQHIEDQVAKFDQEIKSQDTPTTAYDLLPLLVHAYRIQQL